LKKKKKRYIAIHHSVALFVDKHLEKKERVKKKKKLSSVSVYILCTRFELEKDIMVRS
jgi:hypothetical protein